MVSQFIRDYRKADEKALAFIDPLLNDGSRRQLIEGAAEGVNLMVREGTNAEHFAARIATVTVLGVIAVVGLIGFFCKYVSQVTNVVEYVKYDKSDSDQVAKLMF